MAAPPDLPRVTHVLAAAGLAPDYSAIPAAVLEKARWQGSRLHEVIEGHIYGYLDESEIEAKIRPFFDGYLEFQADTRFKPIVAEVEVIHPTWQYIGHSDAVGWIEETVRVIPDWKSVVSLDVDYVAYQLAAYKMAWEAMHPDQPIHRLLGVQFRPWKGKKYRLHEVGANGSPSVAEATQVFQAAMVLHHARARRAA